MAEVALQPDKYPLPPREGPTGRGRLAQLGRPVTDSGSDGESDDELVA